MIFRAILVFIYISLPCFSLAETTLEMPPNPELFKKQKSEEIKASKNPDKQSFNINHAVQLALQNNPQIKQAEKELEAIEENESQAIASFLPQISGDVQYGRQRNAIGGSDFEYSDVNTKSLRISQAIWNGGSDLSRYDTAILQVEHARLRLEQAKQEVALDTKIAYINVAFDELRFKLAVANERLHKQHLTITEDRFKLGELSHTDFSQSSTRHTLALSGMLDAENEFNRSKYELEKLVGNSVKKRKFETEISLPEIPETLKDAIKLAEAENLLIKQSEVEKHLADENIDSAFAENLPSLTLEAALNREEESGLLAQEYDNDFVAMRLSVPIFDGGGSYSKVSQARRAAQAKDFAAIDIKKAVVTAIKETWLYIKSSDKSLDLNLSAIKSAERALEGTKAEEGIGARTVLDVLNSEQERINAVANLIQSKRQQLISYYKLLNFCGSTQNSSTE